MQRHTSNTLILMAIGLSLLGFGPRAYARKTNQAVYEEPFDLAGGGASLTRASREGTMFANPALMPWGGVFYRWFGMTTSILANRESIAFANDAAGGNVDPEALVDDAFDRPIHFGLLNAISFISNNFGLGVFGRFEPDIAGESVGVSGLPALAFSAEAYGGGVMSLAAAPTSFFSLGATVKYLYVSEPDIEIELTDTERLGNLANPDSFQEEVSPSSGVGVDVGTLFFLQGKYLDFRWATKVDDVGNTRFQGGTDPFLQTVHTGIAFTIHNTTEALHLALDYRDITNAYEEKLFKKIYAGAKLLIQNQVGFAVGLYQMIPSAGVKLDLVIFKLGFTAYGRELGNFIGDKQRNLYVATIEFGV